MVITGLLFWYFQYYKKGKHSFECLSRCRHTTIRDKQVEGASDETPSPLELVPLSKKGVRTAPPGEEESVKVEDTSWPLWAYILINLGNLYGNYWPSVLVFSILQKG